MDHLVVGLQDEANQWLAEGKTDVPPVPASIRALYPTEENLAALAANLQRPVPPISQPKPNPEYLASEQFQRRFHELYVRYNLLLPLRYAAPKELAKMLELFTQLNVQAAYLDLPDFQGKNEVPLPATSPSGPPRQITRAQVNRRVILHNILVRKIRGNITLLRLLAADAQADRGILESFLQHVGENDLFYRDDQAGLEQAVTTMTPERARYFYENLRQAVQRYGDARNNFTDRTKLSDGGAFATEARSAGADTAELVNVLATRARQPAIVVPGAAARPPAGRTPPPRPPGR